MISTIVGAYRYTTKDGVDRINLTLSNDHEGAFGRPCITKDFNAKNFQTSTGESIPFTEKMPKSIKYFLPIILSVKGIDSPVEV